MAACVLLLETTTRRCSSEAFSKDGFDPVKMARQLQRRTQLTPALMRANGMRMSVLSLGLKASTKTVFAKQSCPPMFAVHYSTTHHRTSTVSVEPR